MITLFFKRFELRKCCMIFAACISMFMFGNNVLAQNVLFDFNDLPVHSGIPGSYTVGGITAHFSATGQGFSIQDNSSPISPKEFSGNFIYANSVYASDLLVSLDQTITDFSIMVSTVEYGCDCSAIMRLTANMNGTQVGTITRTAFAPGTWPVDTLRITLPDGFNSVVVHYDGVPPCPACDYAPVFLADNMRVTEIIIGIAEPKLSLERLLISNPVSSSASISFSLSRNENLNIYVYDITGRMIKEIFHGNINKGSHQFNLDAEAIKDGVYFLKVSNNNYSISSKLVVVK